MQVTMPPSSAARRARAPVPALGSSTRHPFWIYASDMTPSATSSGVGKKPKFLASEVFGRLFPRALVSGEASPSDAPRSEEHTSELQSLMRISYAVFCMKKKKKQTNR